MNVRKMAKTKLTSKGQITVPKDVRERLGLRPGDEIEFVEENGSFVVRRHVDARAFEKWRGFLKDLAGRRADDLVEEMRGR